MHQEIVIWMPHSATESIYRCLEIQPFDSVHLNSIFVTENDFTALHFHFTRNTYLNDTEAQSQPTKKMSVPEENSYPFRMPLCSTAQSITHERRVALKQ